jgi:hypothetical protein
MSILGKHTQEEIYYSSFTLPQIKDIISEIQKKGLISPNHHFKLAEFSFVLGYNALEYVLEKLEEEDFMFPFKVMNQTDKSRVKEATRTFRIAYNDVPYICELKPGYKYNTKLVPEEEQVPLPTQQYKILLLGNFAYATGSSNLTIARANAKALKQHKKKVAAYKKFKST